MMKNTVVVLALLVGLVAGCGLLGETFIARDAGLPAPADTAREVRGLLPPVVEQLHVADFAPEPLSPRYERCAGRANDEFGGDQAVGWRYYAEAELGGSAYEFPEQLESELEQLGWTIRPTDGVNEHRNFDGSIVRLEAQHDLVLMRLYTDRIDIRGPCVPVSEREHDAYSAHRAPDHAPVDAAADARDSSYRRDPGRPAADQQRAAALAEVPGVLAQLRASGAAPQFAIGEYHECSGTSNEDRWPVDGAAWSYRVSGRIDLLPELAETTFLAKTRSHLEHLGWHVRHYSDTRVRAHKQELALEISSLRGSVFVLVSGPCASVSQRQHVEYGMAYRDDFLAGDRS